MTTNFPASLDTSAELPRDIGVNDTLADRVHHTLHNNLSDAVLKIEAVLGAGWSTGTTVRAQFTTMQSTISALSSNSLPRSELTGTIVMWSGTSAPSGWLLCDGSAISRTTYSRLFAITSTRFGVGNGSTTFNVPDLRGKFPVGYNSSEAEFNTFGNNSLLRGQKRVTLLPGEIPAHTHTGTTSADGAHYHIVGAATGTGVTNRIRDIQTNNGPNGYPTSTDGIHTHTLNIANNTPSGNSHPNLPPYLPINFIIKT